MESFEVLKTLGRGNYGQALLVKDKRLPEPGPGDDPEANLLVVKRVPLADMPEAEQRAAMREVALLKALEHPCIVRYLDSFIQDGSLHICMEYCSAGDLGSAIRRARKSGLFFDEGQVLDWFAQVTLAVAYAHKRSVFHRDLKPQNIFLTRTNRVRLGDWGIARVLEHTLDAAVTVVGTPYFLSPEIASGTPYNHKSDMWALGCILFELCALKHAFVADNLLTLVCKIVQERHPPLPAHYSPAVSEMLNGLLAKDASARLDADQVLALPFVADRLRRLAEMEGTTAGRTSPLYMQPSMLSPSGPPAPLAAPTDALAGAGGAGAASAGGEESSGAKVLQPHAVVAGGKGHRHGPAGDGPPSRGLGGSAGAQAQAAAGGTGYCAAVAAAGSSAIAAVPPAGASPAAAAAQGSILGGPAWGVVGAVPQTPSGSAPSLFSPTPGPLSRRQPQTNPRRVIAAAADGGGSRAFTTGTDSQSTVALGALPVDAPAIALAPTPSDSSAGGLLSRSSSGGGSGPSSGISGAGGLAVGPAGGTPRSVSARFMLRQQAQAQAAGQRPPSGGSDGLAAFAGAASTGSSGPRSGQSSAAGAAVPVGAGVARLPSASAALPSGTTGGSFDLGVGAASAASGAAAAGGVALARPVALAVATGIAISSPDDPHSQSRPGTGGRSVASAAGGGGGSGSATSTARPPLPLQSPLGLSSFPAGVRPQSGCTSGRTGMGAGGGQRSRPTSGSGLAPGSGGGYGGGHDSGADGVWAAEVPEEGEGEEAGAAAGGGYGAMHSARSGSSDGSVDGAHPALIAGGVGIQPSARSAGPATSAGSGAGGGAGTEDALDAAVSRCLSNIAAGRGGSTRSGALSAGARPSGASAAAAAAAATAVYASSAAGVGGNGGSLVRASSAGALTTISGAVVGGSSFIGGDSAGAGSTGIGFGPRLSAVASHAGRSALLSPLSAAVGTVASGSRSASTSTPTSFATAAASASASASASGSTPGPRSERRFGFGVGTGGGGGVAGLQPMITAGGAAPLSLQPLHPSLAGAHYAAAAGSGSALSADTAGTGLHGDRPRPVTATAGLGLSSVSEGSGGGSPASGSTYRHDDAAQDAASAGSSRHRASPMGGADGLLGGEVASATRAGPAGPRASVTRRLRNGAPLLSAGAAFGGAASAAAYSRYHDAMDAAADAAAAEVPDESSVHVSDHMHIHAQGAQAHAHQSSLWQRRVGDGGRSAPGLRVDRGSAGKEADDGDDDVDAGAVAHAINASAHGRDAVAGTGGGSGAGLLQSGRPHTGVGRRAAQAQAQAQHAAGDSSSAGTAGSGSSSESVRAAVHSIVTAGAAAGGHAGRRTSAASAGAQEREAHDAALGVYQDDDHDEDHEHDGYEGDIFADDFDDDREPTGAHMRSEGAPGRSGVGASSALAASATASDLAQLSTLRAIAQVYVAKQEQQEQQHETASHSGAHDASAQALRLRGSGAELPPSRLPVMRSAASDAWRRSRSAGRGASLRESAQLVPGAADASATAKPFGETSVVGSACASEGKERESKEADHEDHEGRAGRDDVSAAVREAKHDDEDAHVHAAYPPAAALASVKATAARLAQQRGRSASRSVAGTGASAAATSDGSRRDVAALPDSLEAVRKAFVDPEPLGEAGPGAASGSRSVRSASRSRGRVGSGRSRSNSRGPASAGGTRPAAATATAGSASASGSGAGSGSGEGEGEGEGEAQVYQPYSKLLSRASLDRMRAQGRRALGPLLFDRVYRLVADHKLQEEQAREAGAADAAGSAGSRRALASQLRALVAHDPRLLAECARVEELQLLEGLLAARERERARAAHGPGPGPGSGSAGPAPGPVAVAASAAPLDADGASSHRQPAHATASLMGAAGGHLHHMHGHGAPLPTLTPRAAAIIRSAATPRAMMGHHNGHAAAGAALAATPSSAAGASRSGRGLSGLGAVRHSSSNDATPSLPAAAAHASHLPHAHDAAHSSHSLRPRSRSRGATSTVTPSAPHKSNAP